MNAINYQKELERILRQLNDRVPHLLLHSCCAPCSSYCLEYLSEYFEITLFYFNPNIFPADEYTHRVEEQRRLVMQQPHAHAVHLIEGEYRPEEFFDAVRGMEQQPEGGSRCRICFEMRLRQAAKVAKEIGADFFTTTLTIGPRKDAKLLNDLGTKIEAETGVPYLHSDFKKNNGYHRSIELSALYGLYRQNYCGCIFSRRSPSK